MPDRLHATCSETPHTGTRGGARACSPRCKDPLNHRCLQDGGLRSATYGRKRSLLVWPPTPAFDPDETYAVLISTPKSCQSNCTGSLERRPRSRGTRSARRCKRRLGSFTPCEGGPQGGDRRLSQNFQARSRCRQTTPSAASPAAFSVGAVSVEAADAGAAASAPWPPTPAPPRPRHRVRALGAWIP